MLKLFCAFVFRFAQTELRLKKETTENFCYSYLLKIDKTSNIHGRLSSVIRRRWFAFLRTIHRREIMISSSNSDI